MRVLFFMTHPGFSRNFESTLRELSRRGHAVAVALDREAKVAGDRSDGHLGTLAQTLPGLSVVPAPGWPRGSWEELGRGLRLVLDSLRYRDPAYGEAAKARRRAERRVPAALLRLAARPAGLKLLRLALRTAERGLPVSPAVQAFIESSAPDAVVVTPLVELGSPQTAYVRAARDLGVPTVLAVASWDNLTIKGGVHEVPDLVAVWNEAQKREAVELQGIPQRQVSVVGAGAYDHWFGWEPSAGRVEFCERLGLDGHRPFVLYVGSSAFIAPEETALIRSWVGYASEHGMLDTVQILVRPHPTEAGDVAAELGELSGLVVYPPRGADPVAGSARADYYDSLHYSAAVAGVNTSAFVEASIVGTPTHAMLWPELYETQAGMAHFRHLLPEGGGVLQTAHSLGRHWAQVQRSIGASDGTEARRRFVSSFVRPRGPDLCAAEALTDEIELLVLRNPPSTVSRSNATRLARRSLAEGVRLAARMYRRRTAAKRR